MLRLLSWIISEAAVLRCSKIFSRKLQRKHPWWNGFVIKIKEIYNTTDVFQENFSKFSEQSFCRSLPVSNSLKSSGWNYLFLFWTLTCFLSIFSLRSELLLNCLPLTSAVETPDASIFLYPLKKILVCLVVSYY